MLPEQIEADRRRALELTPVSPETLARLDRYVALLLQWQQKMNLVASSTLPHLWTRHIADSLQLRDLAPAARTWVDIGSGAGFPGLILACALADRPGARVHLIESIRKKATFLREAAAAADIPVFIHNERFDEFLRHLDEPVHAVTARAVSSLKTLLDQCFKVISQGAVGIFPKGQDVATELTEASKYWNITYDLAPSRTDSSGTIVVVRSLKRRSPARL